MVTDMMTSPAGSPRSSLLLQSSHATNLRVSSPPRPDPSSSPLQLRLALKKRFIECTPDDLEASSFGSRRAVAGVDVWLRVFVLFVQLVGLMYSCKFKYLLVQI